jgi:hypothetical protein
MKSNVFLLSAATMVNAAIGADPVDLGTAANYVILSKAGITVTPITPSTITGDIAVSPIAATAITGFSLILDSSTTFSTSAQVEGEVYAADYTSPTSSELTTAVSDMETAYTDAAGRTTTGGFFDATFGTSTDDDSLNLDSFINLGDGEIGGLWLAPGVYTFDRQVNISANVYFNAGDDADAVFIIQTSKGVKQDPSTNVILENGAQARNIFWSVAEDFIVGTGSNMEGVLLVKTAVTIETDSTLNGRILAQTAVALDHNTITEPAE